MTTYIGIVHKDKKSVYGVSFPDFVGCISMGETADELQTMAEEAINFHIEGLMEDGDPIPAPMSLASVKKHPLAKHAEAFIFVKALVPGKPKRVNVMLDSNLIDAIDRLSNNRSQFLSVAARHEIERRAE